MALTDNLISYYKLESNSNDSVWANNGTDTSVSYGTGKIWNAGSFNGTTSNILANTSDIFGTSPVSISCWVNCTSFPALTSPLTFIEATVDAGTNDKTIRISSTGNTQFFIFDWVWKIAQYDTIITSLNTWYHIVGTYDGATVKVYVNWVIWGTTATATGSFNFTTPKLAFSSTTGWATNRFNGSIDEVGIWNRAITTTEITQLYNGWNWLSYPFTSSANLLMFL